MAQVINTNVASLNAQRHLNDSKQDQEVALERLSSGLRINSARDDAAGLAISERFTSQINGMDQAARNANDGISFAQTAEGAMEEMSNLLQRIRELSVQAVNDTNSASDRAALNEEVQQAVQEVNRIAETTQFNQQNVLNGTLRELVFQVGANRGQTINTGGVDVRAENLGAAAMEGRAVQRPAGDSEVEIPERIQINGHDIDLRDAQELNDMAREINDRMTETGVSANRADRAQSQPVAFDTLGEGQRAQLRINDVAIEIDDEIDDLEQLARRVNEQSPETGVRMERDDDNGEWSLVSNRDFEVEYIAEDGAPAQAFRLGDDPVGEGLDRDDPDSGGLSIERGIMLSTELGGELRVGPGEGALEADLARVAPAEETTEADLAGIGLKRFDQDENAYVDLETEEFTVGGASPVDVQTRESASDAILAVDFALRQINSARADLGAIQNRFDATINNLNISSENLSASRSRILDADFAEETAEMTRTQILQQAGTSVLGQANEMPQQVVQLLQQ